MQNKPTHQEMVSVLAKPGQDILGSLTPEDCHAWHMASCVGSEAGELFDAVKRQVIYRNPIDRANLIEEFGDIEFYLEGLRQAYGITRKETLEANITKLGARYDKFRYSDQSAQNRADKSPQVDHVPGKDGNP